MKIKFMEILDNRFNLIEFCKIVCKSKEIWRSEQADLIEMSPDFEVLKKMLEASMNTPDPKPRYTITIVFIK